MAKFGPGEARAWARENLRGVAGCLSATMTADMAGLNEQAVRYDVALSVEHGFAGLLVVGECGTTPAEMRQMIDIAVDETGDRQVTILQASESTLRENLELIAYAEQAGVDVVLPSFPLTFYPRSEEEIYDYYRSLADSTTMGMIVFAIHLWNFGRLHPSSFSPDLIGRLVEDCPNVVAIKNEIGAPGVAGICEVFDRFGDQVVVTDPFEMNAPAWVRNYGMQFLGTSNYEYLGPLVPQIFSDLAKGDFESAMKLYWQTQPARQTNMKVMGEAVAGTSLVPRMIWKYQGWLCGYNGGPLRSPQGRLSDSQMATLRRSLAASGVPVTAEEDPEFFVGRHPATSS